MGGPPKGDIARLRRRAGALGITIRTQRANRASDRRAYTLVDRTSGMVLHRDIDALIDVEAALARLVWDRQRARADGPPAPDAPPSCPACGTLRVGQFRWCRSCGHDFEAMAHIVARWPPFQLAEPAADAISSQPVEEPPLPAPVSDLAPRARILPEPRHRPGLEFRIGSRDRLSSLPIRQLEVGALIGLIVGVITAVLLNLR